MINNNINTSGRISRISAILSLKDFNFILKRAVNLFLATTYYGGKKHMNTHYCIGMRSMFCILISLGGLKKKRIPRKRCGICGHVFKENESKSMYPHEDFFRCSICDDGRIEK